MQKIQEDESTIRAAEKKVAAADERIRDAEQEVTDTIATFGGGDSEGNGGASRRGREIGGRLRGCS